MRKVSLLASLFVLCWLPTASALDRPARCFASDDGFYDCRFRSLDRAGSFVVSARGKPTFTIIRDPSDPPGVAAAFLDVGTGRNVRLPFPYRRSAKDLACWEFDETRTRICAWSTKRGRRAAGVPLAAEAGGDRLTNPRGKL